jgi:hypothetical protein
VIDGPRFRPLNELVLLRQFTVFAPLSPPRNGKVLDMLAEAGPNITGYFSHRSHPGSARELFASVTRGPCSGGAGFLRKSMKPAPLSVSINLGDGLAAGQGSTTNS